MKSLILVTITALTVLGLSVFTTSTALAAPKDSVCDGIVITGGNCDKGETEVNKVVKGVVDLLSIIVGIAAVIMIILGGLKYITSSGDTNKVSSAKNTILYAIVGLVIVAMAQFIVRFVLNRATT